MQKQRPKKIHKIANTASEILDGFVFALGDSCEDLELLEYVSTALVEELNKIKEIKVLIVNSTKKILSLQQMLLKCASTKDFYDNEKAILKIFGIN